MFRVFEKKNHQQFNFAETRRAKTTKKQIKEINSKVLRWRLRHFENLFGENF